MSKEKIEYIVLLLLGIIAGGFILLVAVKHILPAIAPFLIAWVAAIATRGPAKRLASGIRVPEKIIRLMLSLFATLLIFGIIAVCVWQLTGAVWRFLSDIGEGNPVYEILNAITSPSLSIFGDGIPDALAEKISSAISSMVSSALGGLASAVTSWVGFVPNFLLFILITIISLIYFALDLERINATVSSILPKHLIERLSKLPERFIMICKKYVASYLFLMLITYALMLVGFLIIGVEHAVVIALLVAALDILPVIGVGTVLVPWSVCQLVTGNHTVGIGLLVLFVVNTVVRQIAEPKIVGKNLDMHPIMTLVLLYVGYSFFGFTGLILVPVFAVVIGALIDKNHTTEID